MTVLTGRFLFARTKNAAVKKTCRHDDRQAGDFLRHIFERAPQPIADQVNAEPSFDEFV